MKNFFNQKEIFLFFTGLAIVNCLLAIWAYYDHSLPVYDTACHILSGFSVCDLLKHAHPGSFDWWKSLMTVNPLYPPFVYLVYGVLKLLLGPQHWVDLLVHQIFACILYSSMYGLGRLIFKDHIIALLSGLIIFVYSTVFTLAHYDLLDLPGLAMVAFTLFCVACWQEKPSLRTSILLGSAFALASLTKNNCIAFLIPPLLYVFGFCLYSRAWNKLNVLILAGFTSLVILLPWLILACPLMIKTISESEYRNVEYSSTFFDRLSCYLFHIPEIHSYFLSIIFVFALFICTKIFHRRMLFLWCSAVGGIFISAFFNWPPLVRYVLPVTILSALYCALAFKLCWSSPIMRPLSILSIIVVSFAFIENNFTPYPLPRIKLPEPVESFLGISCAREGKSIAAGGISVYPSPANDLGTTWVLNTIKQNQENTQPNLTILPDTEEVSLSTYLYLIKQNGLNINATTLQYYVPAGAKVSPDIALKTNWCLLSIQNIPSSLPRSLKEENSKTYDLCCNFIQSSKHFKLVGSLTLPSGSKLELYKNLSH